VTAARTQTLNLEINKTNKNKTSQFLENIVPENETSKQNSNGYCNVDIVFCCSTVHFDNIKVFLTNKCTIY
jgi:hypothetical protein